MEATVFDFGCRKEPIWFPRGDVTKSMSIVCSWKRKAYTSLNTVERVFLSNCILVRKGIRVLEKARLIFGKYESRMKGPSSLMPKMPIRVLINGSPMLVGSSKVTKVVMIAENVTSYLGKSNEARVDLHSPTGLNEYMSVTTCAIWTPVLGRRTVERSVSSGERTEVGRPDKEAWCMIRDITLISLLSAACPSLV